MEGEIASGKGCVRQRDWPPPRPPVAERVFWKWGVHADPCWQSECVRSGPPAFGPVVLLAAHG